MGTLSISPTILPLAIVTQHLSPRTVPLSSPQSAFFANVFALSLKPPHDRSNRGSTDAPPWKEQDSQTGNNPPQVTELWLATRPRSTVVRTPLRRTRCVDFHVLYLETYRDPTFANFSA